MGEMGLAHRASVACDRGRHTSASLAGTIQREFSIGPCLAWGKSRPSTETADLAGLFAAVAAAGGVVQDRHVLPGQPLEPEGQDRLVVLDREQVVGAALVHQVGGVGALNRESATSALPNSGAAGTR
jgi:hypothetical protein